MDGERYPCPACGLTFEMPELCVHMNIAHGWPERLWLALVDQLNASEVHCGTVAE